MVVYRGLTFVGFLYMHTYRSDVELNLNPNPQSLEVEYFRGTESTTRSGRFLVVLMPASITLLRGNHKNFKNAS